MQNLDVSKTVDAWSSLADTVFVPHTEAEYQRLVTLLDRLIDEVGENECPQIILMRPHHPVMLNGGPLPTSFVSKDEIKGDDSTPEAIAKSGQLHCHAKEKRSESPEENRDLAREALLTQTLNSRPRS